MWQVVFSKNLFDNLNKFLFSTAPSENGCFLVTRSYKTKSGRPVIIVKDVIKPDEESWNGSGEHSLEPSSSFINQSVVAADTTNSGLIFVHTHPNSMHPAKFSPIDEKSNKRIFANLSQILPDRPLASLVFSQYGICGVVFNGGKIQPVSSIKIVGHTLNEFPGVGFDSKPYHSDETYDRQERAIGKESNKKLQDLKITIVGTGGTGSPLAVQLARMGIKRLRVIDKDVLDKTNLPRVSGSKEKDIGKPKVVVLKKHIECFSKTKVEAIQADITTEDLIPVLIDSDVIFSCTDNLTSRSVLNDVSMQYFIPLINVGCRIHKNKDGSINQAIMKVQVVTPDTACLWCTGELNGKIILQESLSDVEKKKLAEEGYYEDVERQPSIVTMTTMVSSMALNKLLGLLGVFGSDTSSLTQIEIKDGFMIDNNPEIKSNCVCQKRKGMTDSRKIILTSR